MMWSWLCFQEADVKDTHSPAVQVHTVPSEVSTQFMKMMCKFANFLSATSALRESVEGAFRKPRKRNLRSCQSQEDSYCQRRILQYIGRDPKFQISDFFQIKFVFNGVQICWESHLPDMFRIADQNMNFFAFQWPPAETRKFVLVRSQASDTAASRTRQAASSARRSSARWFAVKVQGVFRETLLDVRVQI